MKISKLALVLNFLIVSQFVQAQFSAGNIVVCRIGQGTSTSSLVTNADAAPVFLDEYTPSGVLVQSIAMPVATSGSNKRLTLSTAGSFGAACGSINLSADGQFLVLTGFNAPVGLANVISTKSDTTERVIGVVRYDGNVSTSTALIDFGSSAPPEGAVSTNGIDIWCTSLNGTTNIAGANTGGIRYTTTGSASSTRINASPNGLQTLSIASGQLYASDLNKIHSVGTGLPRTPGQTLTALSGLPFGLRMQFVLLDLNPNVIGPDVLYIADEYYGLQKYSLVNASWVLNGTIGVSGFNQDEYRGVAAVVSGTTVTLFATRKGGNSSSIGGGDLVKLVDAAGYNGNFSGVPTIIASTLTDKATFRGVALVPQQAPLCPVPSNPFAFNITPTSATISWGLIPGVSGYQYALTTSPTPPNSGTSTTLITYNATGLTQGQTYYFHLRTDCGNYNTSSWSTVSFVPACIAPPSPTVNNIGYTADIKWNSVYGASGYEYAVTTNATPPASGLALADTSFTATNLSSVTQYYIHVRSNCASGGYSPWVTKAFTTSCLNPIVTSTLTGEIKQFKWNGVNGANAYEYALTAYQTPPLGGTAIEDTSIQFSNLNSGNNYYFHVRTKCVKSGSQSGWTTVPFQTNGLDAYPNPVTNTLTIKLYGLSNTNGEVLISDAMGRVVKKVSMTNNSIDVNVKDLAAGIYMVKYNDGINKYMVKVLKN